MSFNQDSNLNYFLPPFEALPDSKEEFNIKLSSMFSNIAYKTNIRTLGIYETTTQVPTGKSYYPSAMNNPEQLRESVRASYEFTLAAGPATTSVAHGLDLTNKKLTLIQGTVNSPTYVDFVALDYNDGTDSATVRIDATNINVTTTSNSFDAFIVLLNIELMPA